MLQVVEWTEPAMLIVLEETSNVLKLPFAQHTLHVREQTSLLSALLVFQGHEAYGMREYSIMQVLSCGLKFTLCYL